MKQSSTDILARNSIFAWLLLATGLILLIPLIAMQFTDEVNWTIGDFIIMGAMLFGTGSLFILVARRASTTKQRLIIGAVLGIAFIYLWAELAVGIFTNWGS